MRESIMQSGVLIIQDPTLLHQVDLFSSRNSDGDLLINSARSFGELGLGEFIQQFRHERLLTLPANDLARVS